MSSFAKYSIVQFLSLISPLFSSLNVVPQLSMVAKTGLMRGMVTLCGYVALIGLIWAPEAQCDELVEADLLADLLIMNERAASTIQFEDINILCVTDVRLTHMPISSLVFLVSVSGVCAFWCP